MPAVVAVGEKEKGAVIWWRAEHFKSTGGFWGLLGFYEAPDLCRPVLTTLR